MISSEDCPVCGRPSDDVEQYWDRHGIYSGRACPACADQLPGQGVMRDYVADEPIEADE